MQFAPPYDGTWGWAGTWGQRGRIWGSWPSAPAPWRRTRRESAFWPGSPGEIGEKKHSQGLWEHLPLPGTAPEPPLPQTRAFWPHFGHILAAFWPTNIRATLFCRGRPPPAWKCCPAPPCLQDRKIWGRTLPVRVPRVHTPKKKCVIAALAPFSFPKEELLTGANPKLLRHHPRGRFLGPSQAVPGKSPKQRRQRRAKTQPVETRRESQPYSWPQLLGSQHLEQNPNPYPWPLLHCRETSACRKTPQITAPLTSGGSSPLPVVLQGNLGPC